MPGDSEPLLGAIPLEYIRGALKFGIRDVKLAPNCDQLDRSIVQTYRKTKIVNPDHPYMAVMTLK